MDQPVVPLPPLPRANLGQLRGGQSGRGAVVPHKEGSLGGSNDVSVRNVHNTGLCRIKLIRSDFKLIAFVQMCT